ncbi:MAG: hypothetical protein ACRC2B_09820 [Rubrivivax sp.]
MLGLCAEAAGASSGPTTYEFWPGIDAYVSIDERTRMLVTAAATRATEASVEGRTASFQEAQFSINVDYTLAPVLRRDVPLAEWSKNRLLWARLGFNYGTSLSSGTDAYRSYAGVVELNSRFSVAGDLWLTNRLRADFRQVNGEPSQRYRVRVGAEWAAMAFEHPYSPYADVELLYDTRYERWSRSILKAGLETPIGPDWRIEPYIALQIDKPDEQVSRVLGFGLTFKVYFP